MTNSTGTPEHRRKLDRLETNFGQLCFLISKDMRTALDRSLAAFDLRAQPAAVLLHCFRQRGASPSHLASIVGTDTAGITGLLDQLEKRDLVIRRANPSDRRGAIVETTAKGQGILPQISKVFRALQAQMLVGLSDEEVSRLGELLQRVRQNVGEAVGK